MTRVKIAAFFINRKPFKHFKVPNWIRNQKHSWKILELTTKIERSYLHVVIKILWKLSLKVH